MTCLCLYTHASSVFFFLESVNYISDVACTTTYFGHMLQIGKSTCRSLEGLHYSLSQHHKITYGLRQLRSNLSGIKSRQPSHFCLMLSFAATSYSEIFYRNQWTWNHVIGIAVMIVLIEVLCINFHGTWIIPAQNSCPYEQNYSHQ